MIVYEKNEISKLEVELDIMNSNPAYNIISKDREKIDEEDIRNEYLECKRLNTERLLVKQNDAYIGLIDYCFENPSDNLTWISLFVIHQKYQGNGTATFVYQSFENMIKQMNKKILRLAVHKQNERGLRFWSKLGYKIFKEVEYQGKLHYCLEKEI
jgi:GNAT superfamily N-acetyltransferase